MFTAVTISQVGMVRHHAREREPGWRRSQVINATEAVATGLVLTIVVVSKFTTGRGSPRSSSPSIVLLFRAVHRLYQHVGRQLRIPVDWQQVERVHVVVLLVGGVHRGTLEALAYARALRPERLVAGAAPTASDRRGR